MALSGSFYKNVGSYWRVRVTWSGSQSVSGNYTDITMRVYWESTGSAGTTYTSSTKSGSSTIDGTTDNFTFSAKLTGRDSRLVNTQTKRVYHNSSGKKAVTLSASLDIDLSLAGQWYGTVSTSKSYDLNTIPRESTMTTSSNFTAGGNRTVSISRHSSSFSHTVDISVENRDGSWRAIKTLSYSTSQTSQSTSFTVAQNKLIFTALDGRASTNVRMVLTTKSGSTTIGTRTYTGTVTSPDASTTTKSSYSFDVEDKIEIDVNREHGAFRHSAEVTIGTFRKTFSDFTTSFDLALTSTEKDDIYYQTRNSSSIKGEIVLVTYYDGVKVRYSQTSSITLTISEAQPTFYSTNISYKDTNTLTSGLTEDNQKIIQDKSNLLVSVDSKAIGNKGASIKYYIVSINGIEKKINSTTTGSVTIGKLSASSNQILTVTAVDSRGLSRTVSKNVTVIPYQEPTLIAVSERRNNFGENVLLKAKGDFSYVDGRNAILSLQYRYSVKGLNSWSTWTSLPFSTVDLTYTALPKNLTLGLTTLYDFQFRVSDRLTSNKMTNSSVGSGRPILFIDTEKSSVSVNKLPERYQSFEFDGSGYFTGDFEVVGSTTLTGKIETNGDITSYSGGSSLKLKHPTTSRTDVAVYAEFGNRSSRFGYVGYGGTDGTMRLMNELSGGNLLISTPTKLSFSGASANFELSGDYIDYNDQLFLRKSSSSTTVYHDANNYGRVYADSSSQQFIIYLNGSYAHRFYANGTKMGGSIIVDGQNLGMSPIDSPQILLEYIEFGIPLSPEGTKVFLDETYLKTVDHFTVFANIGQIEEIGSDYVIVKGEEGRTTDLRIIGERRDHTGVFYGDMDSEIGGNIHVAEEKRT